MVIICCLLCVYKKNQAMKYIIRDYKTEDYEEMMEIWKDLGLGSKERGDNREVIDKTLKMGAKLFILENESKEIIGSSWITFDGRRLLLHHFGIKREYQGKGLSKILMNKTLEYAKEKNIQIKLEVHKDNIKAINLYKQYGFKELGDYLILIIRKY